MNLINYYGNIEKIMGGKTLRLVNFLIDSGVFFTLLIFFMMAFKDTIARENMKWISGVLYFLYYFLFEYFFGQTIGKMITKSKVVSYTGDNKNYFIRLFVRTAMRLIPIDILSYLFTFRGLHDLISMTTVLKITNKTY